MNKLSSRALTALTNGALALILIVLGVVCFLPVASPAAGVEEQAYYRGNSEDGVSLMINVYWGTEEVKGILDVLDDYGATATFFIGGSWADDNVDCVREIYRRGHELASHGYFHKDHSRMSYEANLEEIRPSVKLLNMICNTNITLFAPPSGAFCEATINACISLDLRVIMWSRDTVDWRDKDSDLIFKRATENLKTGEFVLMHPTDCTVTALPRILSYIRDNGFKAITVSQNLGE